MKQNRKEKEQPQGFAASVWILVHDLVYILAAITLIFTFLVRLVGVSGSSMYPTLVGGHENINRGDYLALLSNMLEDTYHAGDIVVACVPSFDNGKPIVKRVVATEGQTVDLREEAGGVWKVYVDGIALDEPYIREPMDETRYQTIALPAKVPQGCYFCMGDNRNNSSDSRDYRIGMIDGRYIVGKALMVVLPGEDATGGNAVTWSRFGGFK